MKVGLDLDNTILDYTLSVEISALEVLRLEIPRGLTKEQQKEYIIDARGGDSWTLVQGYAYGRHAARARVFPGFFEFLDYLLSNGHCVRVLSHKSLTPIAGPAVDMREAAVQTLLREGIWARLATPRTLTSPVVFFDTIESKIEGIATSGLDIFVDDLIRVSESLREIRYSFHIFCDGFPSCSKGVTCVKDWQFMLAKFTELEQKG